MATKPNKIVATIHKLEIPATQIAGYAQDALVIVADHAPYTDGPMVIALAEESVIAFKALEQITGIKEENLYYDHGAWFIETGALHPAFPPFVETSLIMVVYNEVSGYVAAGWLSEFMVQMPKSQRQQVSEFLTEIWA